MVEFDDATADQLIRAADAAAVLLRGQGTTRRGAVEDASLDFSGAYAERLAEGAVIEAADRPKLANVLDELSTQVSTVKEEAAREERRQRDVAAWDAQEAGRRASAEGSSSLLPPSPLTDALFPPPSETAVRPTEIEAAFSARGRPRSGGGASSGRSSADPERLRSFAATSRAADNEASDAATRLRNAWTAFRGACSWARTSDVTFLGGFDRLLAENEADAAWISRIADAFEQAGSSGSLSNAVLDIAGADDLPPGVRQMFDATLTPTQVAQLWAGSGWARADARDLAALPTAVLSQLGNLEGVPYWARNIANRSVLTARIAAQEKYLESYLPTIGYDAGGVKAAAAVEKVLVLAEIERSLVKGERDGDRYLLALTDDDPPLAAVSIGDVDTATNVTWAVPGMGSSTEKMTDWTTAAQHVHDEQGIVAPSSQHAVIAWMGYEAPPVPVLEEYDLSVMRNDAAEAGGAELASSIAGLGAARAANMPTTNVLGHSYGTTTAAFALTREGIEVDAFTTVGSAGLPASVSSADQLHADEVFSGQARNADPRPFMPKGDQWAWTGRLSREHPQDPTAPDFGATTFGADGDGDLRRVTDHGVTTGDASGYLDAGTESLRNVAYATTGKDEKMTR